jgi:hypothetical protein
MRRLLSAQAVLPITVAAMALCTRPSLAHAEGPHAPDPPLRVEPEKKPLPRYDGRPPPESDAGDMALWAPRILLYPFWFVAEYVVRRPLGSLVSWAERKDVPRILYDFFAFGPDHKAGFAPIALIDFGFSPSAGIYFFWDDALIKGQDLSIHGSTWGEDWIAASVRDRYRWNKHESFTFRVSGFTRPDAAYWGTGPRTVDGDRSRYGVTKLETSLLYENKPTQKSVFEAGFAVRSLRFNDTHHNDDPSVSDAINAGRFTAPSAFTTGYVGGESRMRMAVDSRGDGPNAPRSGLRMEAEGAVGEAPGGSTHFGWARYDAIARGMFDINGHDRVLSLSTGAFFADPLGSAQAPFTELVQLGGAGPMPGFVPGRLYGRSAFVNTVQYTWPIWMWLHGTVQASVGNVFGPHLDDIKPSLLRYAGALGISQTGDTDNPVQVLIGVGSETFEHGAQPNSVRLMVGTTHGQ